MSNPAGSLASARSIASRRCRMAAVAASGSRRAMSASGDSSTGSVTPARRQTRRQAGGWAAVTGRAGTERVCCRQQPQQKPRTGCSTTTKQKQQRLTSLGQQAHRCRLHYGRIHRLWVHVGAHHGIRHSPAQHICRRVPAGRQPGRQPARRTALLGGHASFWCRPGVTAQQGLDWVLNKINKAPHL